MSASQHYLAIFFFCSLLVLQLVVAQSSNDEPEGVSPRYVRTPKAKFIRFGRAGAGGAKFIRFGRSGANTWDEDVLETADGLIQEEMAKRAGAKFIRFG